MARAAERMRRQHLATANLIVFVETNRFKPSDPQHTGSKAAQLPVATADTGKLIRAALTALDHAVPARFSLQESGGDPA